MHRKQLSTTDNLFEGLRRMSRFVLRLIASLLCAGLIAGAAPAAAQDDGEDCANGVVVPDPQTAYRVADAGPVRVEIYNLLGQPVNTLVDEVQPAGRYQASWDARDRQGREVVTGVYLMQLHYPGGMEARQLLYLK